MDSALRPLPHRFHRYSPKHRRSGITGYAALARSIAVRFADGTVYLYDTDCPGEQHVERMKELARSGEGLNTYINRRVGRRYSSRLDG